MVCLIVLFRTIDGANNLVANKGRIPDHESQNRPTFAWDGKLLLDCGQLTLMKVQLKVFDCLNSNMLSYSNNAFLSILNYHILIMSKAKLTKNKHETSSTIC